MSKNGQSPSVHLTVQRSRMLRAVVWRTSSARPAEAEHDVFGILAQTRGVGDFVIRLGSSPPLTPRLSSQIGLNYLALMSRWVGDGERAEFEHNDVLRDHRW